MTSRTRLLSALVCVIFAVACSGKETPPAPPPLEDTPLFPRVTDVNAVRVVLEAVRRDQFPELSDVAIVVEAEEGIVFFASNVVLDTLKRPPRERTYRIQVGPALFADPPSNRAIYAVLTHELKHTLDYVGMDEKTLVNFAVDYLLKPQTEYERATDRDALDKGMARGLADYRRWLYPHVLDDEARSEKIRDYYTPDEIDAYVKERNPPDRLP